MLDKSDITNVINKTMKDDSISNFVSTLFEVEVVSHIAHLQTKSFAQHKSFNALYENIVGLRDRFIESYQGKYGIIKGYQSFKVSEVSNIKSFISEKASATEQTRLKIKDGYLQQIIDDILELYYSTLYKLKNLD